jgi:DNA-binding CsgD family transcriptional regulator
VTHLRESLAIFQEIGATRRIPRTLVTLAGVALQVGRGASGAQQGARLLGAAQAIHDRLGWPMAGAARRQYERQVAALGAALGDQAFAAAWAVGQELTLDQAVAEADRIAAAVQTRAESGQTIAPPSVAAYPAGLTEREAEVLRLVARGLTGARVAERLVISPVTVNTHLRNIYSKLGVNSRTAAARFAIENGLV